jgi:hypothetical protein
MLSFISRMSMSLGPQFGSSVLFLLERDRITVGSDSKSYGINREPLQNTCKIAISGSGMLFANAGLLSDFSRRQFVSTARRLMNQGRDVTQVATDFDLAIMHKLKEIAIAIRCAFPMFYRDKVDHKPFYQVAFAVLTPREGPKLSFRAYEPVSVRGEIEIRTHQGECVNDCAEGHIALGHFDNIDRYIAMHPTFIKQSGPVEAMKYLLGLEVQANPSEVGLPLAIVSVDDSGIHWIEKGPCP